MSSQEAEKPVLKFSDPRFRKSLRASAAKITRSPKPESFKDWAPLSPQEFAEALRYLVAFFYLRGRVNRRRYRRQGVETKIRSAAQVVLARDGNEEIEVFLGKRINGGFEKQWGSQGGRVDEGESPEEAAVRETKEEAGVSIGADALVPVSRYISHSARVKDGRFGNTEYHVSLFAVRADGLEPYNASEKEHDPKAMGWHTVRKFLEMHERSALTVPGERNDLAEDTLTPSTLRIMLRLSTFQTVDEALAAIGAVEPEAVKTLGIAS